MKRQLQTQRIRIQVDKLICPRFSFLSLFQKLGLLPCLTPTGTPLKRLFTEILDSVASIVTGLSHQFVTLAPGEPSAFVFSGCLNSHMGIFKYRHNTHSTIKQNKNKTYKYIIKTIKMYNDLQKQKESYIVLVQCIERDLNALHF